MTVTQPVLGTRALWVALTGAAEAFTGILRDSLPFRAGAPASSVRDRAGRPRTDHRCLPPAEGTVHCP
jgi:hypothetical protein